jgi:hypothetical protein
MHYTKQTFSFLLPIVRPKWPSLFWTRWGQCLWRMSRSVWISCMEIAGIVYWKVRFAKICQLFRCRPNAPIIMPLDNVHNFAISEVHKQVKFWHVIHEVPIWLELWACALCPCSGIEHSQKPEIRKGRTWALGLQCKVNI